ncbi:hypothetical protein [Enterovibrio norvegicus]|uniref:hypothetical protein n=1 Tax=Enterovibrio norvegicus TaxID=188144 RepID=UPI0024B0D27D|nr:hypothetical protein [Enterovibrio norvegicus]
MPILLWGLGGLGLGGLVGVSVSNGLKTLLQILALLGTAYLLYLWQGGGRC